MNTYILTYNPTATVFTHAQIHTLITSNRHVKSWYAAYPGSYLMKSDATLSVLVQSLRGFFEAEHFFMAQVFPQLTGGAFPASIWDWINTDTLPQVQALLTS